MDESPGGAGMSLIDTPIFVLGMTLRCGANIVARALLAHRETTGPNTLQEDYLLSRLADLDAYWRGVGRGWGAASETELAPYRRMFGRSLVDILNRDRRDANRRLVAKTPSVEGLPLIRSFLPDVPVIAIVRNGPDALDALKNDPAGFDALALRWKAAAEAVLQAEAAIEAGGEKEIIVLRYEEVIADPAGLAKALAEPLGLAPGGFDHAELASLDPTAGSARRGPDNVIHWTPARPRSFDSVEAKPRQLDWEPAQYKRFDQLTEGISEALGYELPHRYEEGRMSKLRHRLRSRFSGKFS